MRLSDSFHSFSLSLFLCHGSVMCDSILWKLDGLSLYQNTVNLWLPIVWVLEMKSVRGN